MNPHSYTSDAQRQQQHQQHSHAAPATYATLRRPHVPQPPMLHTAVPPNLGGIHGYYNSLSANNGTTPLSATSLSTPFSAHSITLPVGQVPTMAARGAPGYGSATPYNPQEWVSPQAAAQYPRPAVRYAPRMVGPDEPMVSPPPPYSAEPTTSPNSASPATDRSYRAMPASAATSISPSSAPVPSGPERTMTHTSTVSISSPLAVSTAFPPPPGTQSRSNSRNPAERFLHAMNIRNAGSSPVSSPSSIDALHQNTAQILQSAHPASPPIGPPGARRAASTGALGQTYDQRMIYSNSPAHDLGITLPPPPPGPPPSTSRSQSACRPMDLPPQSAGPAPLALHPRHQSVARGSNLGPIPPTPAGWEDERHSPNSSITSERDISQVPLRVETENIVRDNLTQSPMSGELSGSPGAAMSGRVRADSSGLVRSPAVRTRSAQGLRDRRSESRRGIPAGSCDSAGSDAGKNPLSRPLKDLVITGDSTGQRRASTRLTPQSGRFRGLDEALTSGDSDHPLPGGDSANSTPRNESARQGKTPSNPASPNSPFSPNRAGPSSSQSWRTSAARRSLHRSSNGSLRPVSHILHLPNEDEVKVSPLRPESSQSVRDEDPDSTKNFAARAKERYHLFAQQEANAGSDSERLQLFSQFMIAESQLRREKYSAVFQVEDIKISDLIHGAFEASEDRPLHVISQPPRKDNATSATGTGSRRSSATSYADSGSHSRPGSSSSTSEPMHLTIDTTVNDPRSKSFVPALSPIASTSAVTGRDDMDSRGRAPSRWWESRSESSDGLDIFKRSKRESKYMSAVLENEVLPSFGEIYHAEASTSHQYGENEYPPEKVGWHQLPASAVPMAPTTPSAAPYTPDPRKLDISRLITLPPAYPRRHPAVNNSHPDLEEERATVRALNEMSEINTAGESFDVQLQEKRQRSSSWCEHQRSLHNQEMQFRMERDEMTQRDYDVAEAALEAKLGQAKKDLHQQAFDLFQSVVVTPIHALINERIQRADAAFTSLTTRLNSDAETHSPNHPQEAGDGKAELLEKLTVLKWLFEAREGLHRTKHKMLTQRNEYYKAVILTPYELAGNVEKRAEADAFFVGDARKRKTAYDASMLQRWKELHQTIEEHVTKGVEVQLSAFWDIAPPLQALLQQIPSRNLKEFSILIPRSEVDENEIYWEHPLRYLYSVLVHAEASSRQFIEGQVSLWCLLQAVREGYIGMRWRARASQKLEVSRGLHGLDERDEKEQSSEMRKGIADLKERVGAVEEQWIEGLGGAINGVKETVRNYLKRTGGWDDELEEGGE